MCYAHPRFPLTGCSSDWQSAAFGTQKSLVQIQSPRLSFCRRGIRLALVGGVVAAAVGGGTSPSDAENVVPRGDEVVAREAPGTGQAGIAILHGTDHVRLLAERDGWSEILLADGRRAWVPAGDLARSDDQPRAKDAPTISATPTIGPEVGALLPDHPKSDLAAEIARLRLLVDELESWRTASASHPASANPPFADEIPWLIGGVALVVGLLVGGAYERFRSRRDRSLRF